MKPRMPLPLLALLLCLLPLQAARADRFPSAPHIYVTGEAVQRLSPDFVELRFSVARTGADVAATKQQVDEITDKVWNAAKKLGISREDFRASSFSVRPQYDFDNGKRQYRGTEVARHYTVRLRELDTFDTFSQRIVELGVQDVPGIHTDVDEREAKLAALRVTALHNARDEASRLAAALDHTLSGVHTIADRPIDGGGGGPVPMRMRMEAASAPDAPTLPQHVELRAEAYVVFLIMPK